MFTNTADATIYVHGQDGPRAFDRYWEAIIIPTGVEGESGIHKLSEVTASKPTSKHHTLRYLTEEGSNRSIGVRRVAVFTPSAVSQWLSEEQASKFDIWECKVTLREGD